MPKIEFLGEAAIDGGGPRREFFRLILDDLLNHSRVFHHVGNGVTCAHNIAYSDSGKFVEAGTLIAWSILHGGPGLHALSPQCIQLLCGELPSLRSWSTFPMDKGTKRLVGNLATATPSTWEATLDEVLEDLERDGFQLAMLWTFQNRDTHINSILTHHFYYRAFTDFKLGMNYVGNLWETISGSTDLHNKLLSATDNILTPDDFENLFDFRYSERGTNKYMLEQQTVFSMSMFLSKLEVGIEFDWEDPLDDPNFEVEENEHGRAATGGECVDLVDDPNFVGNLDEQKNAVFTFKGRLCLQNSLAVLTGADRIPPYGFCKRITVSFFDKKEGVLRYPKFCTCGLTLDLPRGYNDDVEFSQYIEIAVRNCLDYFGHV